MTDRQSPPPSLAQPENTEWRWFLITTFGGVQNDTGLAHSTSRTKLTPQGIRISYNLHLLHSCQTSRVFLIISNNNWACFYLRKDVAPLRNTIWSLLSSPHYMHASRLSSYGFVAWRLGVRSNKITRNWFLIRSGATFPAILWTQTHFDLMEPESRRNAQSKTVLDLVQRTNISFLYGVIYWDLQGSFRVGDLIRHWPALPLGPFQQPRAFHILAICVHLSWYIPATLIDRIASQSPIVLLLYNSTSYEFTHIRPGLHHLSASFGSYMNHRPHPLPLNWKLRHFIGNIPSCICKPSSLPRLLKDVVAVADLRSACRSRELLEVNSAGRTVPRRI